MNIIDGKKIAETIYENIKSDLSKINFRPKLGIILASDDEASKLYVEKMKIKKAESLGIDTELKSFDSTATIEQVIEAIEQFNKDKNINGILVQVPFYQHLEQYRYKILNAVDPIKDVDGLTALNLGLSSQLDETAVYPATVDAIIECIKFVSDESQTNLSDFLKGKNILVINNTVLIGKPLAMILSSYEATVVVANKFTKNLSELCKNADILISATNKTNLIDSSLIKDNAIVIDVTSNKVENKVIGDIIVSDTLLEKNIWLTPVPGGVGPLTIASLMKNVVRLAILQNK